MKKLGPRLLLLMLALAFALSPFVSNGFGGFYPESFPVQVGRWPAQPAGWAFSIWGLIFLCLVLSAGWSVLRPDTMPGWDRVSWPLGISLFLGVFWIEAAMRSPLVATAMILPMTICAIIAMSRLSPDWRETGAIGLFAGWLTAASGVAVSVVLTGYGILAPRPAAIALILLVLLTAVAVSSWRPQVWLYRAGVIWALIGTTAANAQSQDWTIVAVCLFGLLVLLVSNRIKNYV